MATVKTSLSGERSSSVRANEPGMFDPKSSSQDSRRPCIITHLGLVQNLSTAEKNNSWSSTNSSCTN
ncbi:hypothetical protein Pcinc_012481 [Petrolisthes cinctipes]|uniref:Uncharacterized protein n=1 Tax=Petrolisthes cinctipes TaxID=88211 RepID=A0AAE1G4N8_PETCI|nr:hypothetical protein Pcinc_012481 [Petrolisthes cinctipes]